MNLIRRLFKAVLAGVGIAVFGCSISSSAAVAFVIVGANNTDTFTPAVTNINVGDQVVWNWNYTSTFIPHDCASGTNGAPSGLWQSFTNTSPHLFTNTFNSAGTYRYYCGVHFATPHFMTGAVEVASANLPPTVAITNPVSGTVFAAPANLTIQASATGNGGAVTNVQFLVGTTVLSNDITAPYSAVTNNLAAGNYTLAAIASDSGGLKATNSVTIVVDTPPSVAITNPASGAVFAAPANVTIQASAADADGSVTNVQFLVGTTVLSNDVAAPYSAVTNNLATGSYTLSAVVSDNNGIKATNAGTLTISVVTPVTVLLGAPQRLTPTNLQFSYTANAGLTYIVQRSTNLVANNWISIITNLAGSSSVTFTDVNATVNPGFYRVGRLPNP